MVIIGWLMSRCVLLNWCGKRLNAVGSNGWSRLSLVQFNLVLLMTWFVIQWSVYGRHGLINDSRSNQRSKQQPNYNTYCLLVLPTLYIINIPDILLCIFSMDKYTTNPLKISELKDKYNIIANLHISIGPWEVSGEHLTWKISHKRDNQINSK